MGIKQLIFEENSKLETIGEYAFGDLQNGYELTTITIPDSVTSNMWK